ncbi:MAG TPA: TetR/AcrR family transcriptional regulator [Pseudolabrys sp.]|nr:TetR/AcrR family transcriptional regulator [Pseudolabrys sp.]
MTERDSAAGRPRRAPHAARDLILKAATEAFVEHGFSGTSIEQIAARSGVSKPTIYSHFDSKEALFVAILNSVCDSFVEPILGPGADAEELSGILLKIAARYTRAVLRPDIIALHRLFVAEAERFPEPSRRYFEVGPERVHRTLADFFKLRMGRGEIRQCDPLVLAELFAALVLGPMRARQLFALDKEVDWARVDSYSRDAVALFLEGCRAGKSPENVPNMSS